jgi:transposase InsO family protein
MKDSFQHIGLARLCGWFGISRQAYYQNGWEGVSTTAEEELVLQKVLGIRKQHRRIGTRKLYEMMQSFMMEHNIKMGRDALFTLLSANGLLIRKRKRRVQTTNSQHWLRRYPNLIRDFVPTAINQLWVSDITYWKVGDRYVYISFITDAFSHKIVGYFVSETLEATGSIEALRMALSALGAESHPQLTHHSDRGIQYCSQQYVKLLQDYDIQISMTENGDPLENAMAERINGIMKEEYLETYQVDNIEDAKALLKDVVDLYNAERPHMSIGYATPDEVHQSNQPIKTEKLWKNYYRKQPTIVNQLQD